MATSSVSDESKPKRPRVSPKVLVERCQMADKILSYQPLPPVEAPGYFSTVSTKRVRAALKRIALYNLYPIRLEPKEDYNDLNHAFHALSKGDPLSFSKIGTRINARLDLGIPIPLGAFYGTPLTDPSDAFIRGLGRDIQVLAFIMHPARSMSSEATSSNLEHHHGEVLAQICSLMLGPNSIVLRECEVGSPEVPHGTLDLVAGKMDKDQPYSVAVTIDSEEFMVTDLVGLEAKSPQTMRVRAINPQIAVEACVFDEVREGSLMEAPTVFLSANTQTLRPFIRMKKHDFLLSTDTRITWNDPNAEEGLGLTYGGVTLLLLMLQSSAVGSDYYPKLVSTHVNTLISERKQEMQLPCGWNDYYRKCGRQYGNIIPQHHTLSTKTKQLSRSEPTMSSEDTLEKILGGSKGTVQSA